MKLTVLLKKIFGGKRPKRNPYRNESESPIAVNVDLSKPKIQIVRESVIDLYEYGYTHCTSKMIYAYLDGQLTIGDISKCLYRLGKNGFVNNTTRLSTIADTDRSGLYWTLSNPNDYVQD